MTQSRSGSLIGMRLIAVANIAFAVVGGYLLFDVVSLASARLGRPPLDGPHAGSFLWAFSILQLAFLAGLLLSGIGLFRRKKAAAVIAAVVFSAEILYSMVTSSLVLFVNTEAPMYPSMRTSISLTNVATALQILPIYPLLALMALMWLWPSYFGKTDFEA